MKKIILPLVMLAILTTSVVSISQKILYNSTNEKIKTDIAVVSEPKIMENVPVVTQSIIDTEVSPIQLSERPLSKIDADYLFNVQDKDVLYEKSSYVVKGKFIKASEIDIDKVLGILMTKYTFKIDESFKGEFSKNEQIDVYVIGGQLKVKEYKNLLEKNNLVKKGEENHCSLGEFLEEGFTLPEVATYFIT